MSRIVWCLLFIQSSFVIFAQAQESKLDPLEKISFRSIGPAGMSGRITAVDVDLSNTNRIFAGAASGGVWRSEDGGTSWKPVFDEQNNLSIGAIKINQKNPAEVWAGTGEGNPRNSLNTGNGIYKSLDGGTTWKKMGLENTKTIHRIIVHRDNPNIVFAASLGSPWAPNPERGVFRTMDGGKTWDKILYVNDSTGAADMVVDPNNPNKILVAMWEHGRKPWTFNSGGKGSAIYLTEDGGDNWKKITSSEGLPSGNLGRIGLAIAASRPNIVYALVEAATNGLYKSEDGGKKWKLVSTRNIGNRPFYYSEIYVDPTNENRIYNLYSYVSLSEDGGNSFKTIADYGNNVHPDHHAYWIHPTDPDFMIDGNDGGLYITRDRGVNWTFASNIPVGQFYHVNVDSDFPYNVYGGMQDNGSWVGPSSILKSGGIRNYDFLELYFGDGFDVVPDQLNPRYGYAMSQGGNLSYYDRLTGNNKFIQPYDSIQLRFNWNAGLAADPFRANGIYYGSQFLHYSNDNGESWIKKSPDLTSNDPLKQKQSESGGLTIDDTDAENHTTIIAIAPSPVDSNVIWVGTDDGNLQITRDGGKTWKNSISSIKSAPANAWIPFIEVSKYVAGEAFVVVNNYRQNDYKPYAYHTSDFGQTWRRIADESQIDGFVLCVVQHPRTPNLLFMGTDAGLYVSYNKGTAWELLKKGFPQVQVSDLKIQERENDLIIATFGRALWVLDDLAPFEAKAKDAKFYEKPFAVLPPQDAYLVTNRSVDGIRFIGQSEFVGQNKYWRTANFNVWKSKPVTAPKTEVKKEKPKEKDKKGNKLVETVIDTVSMKRDTLSKDSTKKENILKVVIINAEGDTVRNFSKKILDGMNKVAWGLESNGIKLPERRRQSSDEEKDPPSGPDVLPGKYAVYFKYNEYVDSTMVDVKMDPRQKVSIRAIKSKDTAYRAFAQKLNNLNTGFQQLNEARESIRIVEALLTHQPDSIKKEVNLLSSKMQSKIDSIIISYFGKMDEKGYLSHKELTSNKVNNALSYYDNRFEEPGQNGKWAEQVSTKEVEQIIKSINNFFTTHWVSYQERVKKLNTTIFKEREPLKIE
ncbi:MAG: hypothetical protein IPN72_13230 [Saprospiraceae bacterium]|nr:hypothetical protein [Saprospiraceae bacterium]